MSASSLPYCGTVSDARRACTSRRDETFACGLKTPGEDFGDIWFVQSDVVCAIVCVKSTNVSRSSLAFPSYEMQEYYSCCDWSQMVTLIRFCHEAAALVHALDARFFSRATAVTNPKTG